MATAELSTRRARLRSHVHARPAAFSLSQARSIVGEFFTPNAWIYWTDMLLSWSVAMTAFHIVRQTYVPTWAQGLCFVFSCLLIYRSALFIHELVHLRDGTFRFVWNLLCGIPFLIPSFVYYTLRWRQFDGQCKCLMGNVVR